jgi:hypothetical protein
VTLSEVMIGGYTAGLLMGLLSVIVRDALGLR